MLEKNDLEQIGRVVSVLLENKVDPQLRLLAEGQQAILINLYRRHVLRSWKQK